MAVIVRLTYTQTGRSSLINLETMKSAYRMFEEQTRKVATRINFNSNDFIIVDENLQTIFGLYEANQNGEYSQTPIWDEDETGIKTPNIKNKLIGDYNRNVNQKDKPVYTKSY